MRTLPLFLGLCGLVAAQAAQAASYVFSAPVNGSTVNVATLDIAQSGTDSLFRLTTSFAGLSGKPYLSNFGISGPGPQSLFVSSSNLAPSASFKTKGFKKFNNVNWDFTWGQKQFTNALTSTWTIKNVSASAFGSPFYLKISGLPPGTRLGTISAAPVPEVSNFSMYITGLGLVGLVMLRRRDSKHSASR